MGEPSRASCCSEAAVHRFLRGNGQLNTSAAMQSKARVHRIYSLPGLYKANHGFTRTYLAYVWYASKLPRSFSSKKPSI